MIYQTLKMRLMDAKRSRLKSEVQDIIGIIDAVDKAVFADKKAAGEDFVVQDHVVIAVIKNQIKNISASLDRILPVTGHTDDTATLVATIEILGSFLPAAVEGDALRLMIQELGANSLGQAMGMLKKQSISQCFDYDGAEAAAIAKEIFV